jgi:hypothetical protein
MSVTLRFVTCNDAVSAGIRAFEYGFWASHVEAVLPDGRYFGAHYDGGVVARAKGYDATVMRREQFVSVPATPTQEVAFFSFLKEQDGKPYDLTAIVAIIAQRDWREPDSWFCSELQAAALEACGYLPPLAADVNKITPRDLLLILSGRI